jgi:hypothetical protein
MVQMLYAEEFVRPDFNAMVSVAVDLIHKYNIIYNDDSRVYVDGSANAFIRSLKIALNENHDYEGVIARAKKAGFSYTPERWLGKVEPIMFGAGGAHTTMLAHTKMILDNHLLAIHPSFTKLINCIRTAYENDGSLDKDRTSNDDVFDAFRMALSFFKFERSR